jgi:hypothetical protein
MTYKPLYFQPLNEKIQVKDDSNVKEFITSINQFQIRLDSFRTINDGGNEGVPMYVFIPIMFRSNGNIIYFKLAEENGEFLNIIESSLELYNSIITHYQLINPNALRVEFPFYKYYISNPLHRGYIKAKNLKHCPISNIELLDFLSFYPCSWWYGTYQLFNDVNWKLDYLNEIPQHLQGSPFIREFGNISDNPLDISNYYLMSMSYVQFVFNIENDELEMDQQRSGLNAFINGYLMESYDKESPFKYTLSEDRTKIVFTVKNDKFQIIHLDQLYNLKINETFITEIPLFAPTADQVSEIFRKYPQVIQNNLKWVTSGMMIIGMSRQRLFDCRLQFDQHYIKNFKPFTFNLPPFTTYISDERNGYRSALLVHLKLTRNEASFKNIYKSLPKDERKTEDLDPTYKINTDNTSQFRENLFSLNSQNFGVYSQYIYECSDELREQFVLMIKNDIYLALHFGLNPIYQYIQINSSKNDINRFISLVERKIELGRLEINKQTRDRIPRSEKSHIYTFPTTQVAIAMIDFDEFDSYNDIGYFNPCYEKGTNPLMFSIIKEWMMTDESELRTLIKLKNFDFGAFRLGHIKFTLTAISNLTAGPLTADISNSSKEIDPDAPLEYGDKLTSRAKKGFRRFPMRKKYSHPEDLNDESKQFMEIAITLKFRMLADPIENASMTYQKKSCEFVVNVPFTEVLSLCEPFFIHYARRIYGLITHNLVKGELKKTIEMFILQLHYTWIRYRRIIKEESDKSKERMNRGYKFMGQMRHQDIIFLYESFRKGVRPRQLTGLDKMIGLGPRLKLKEEDQNIILSKEKIELCQDKENIRFKDKIKGYMYRYIKYYRQHPYEGKSDELKNEILRKIK